MQSFLLIFAALTPLVSAGPILPMPPKIATHLSDEHFNVQPDLRYPEEISDHLNETALNGGKRVRPLLCFLSAGLQGIEPQDVLHLARAVEFVHTASLMHDDIIDVSTERRGNPSEWCQSTVTNAVLLGNWLMTQSLLEANSMETSQKILFAIQEMVRGEQVQRRALERKNYNLTDWREVASAKTGQLFALALMLPAIHRGLDDKTVNRYRQLGLQMGQLFQLRDDLDGVADGERGEMNILLMYAAQEEGKNPFASRFSETSLHMAHRKVDYLKTEMARELERALERVIPPVTESAFQDGCAVSLRHFGKLLTN